VSRGGLPADWLGDFFRLSTRVAGEVVRKLRDYGSRVAIGGDISEAERVWFVADLAELAERLARAEGAPLLPFSAPDG
jgi:hypothetical protein